MCECTNERTNNYGTYVLANVLTIETGCRLGRTV